MPTIGHPIKHEKMDVEALNERLQNEDEVVCPKGTYLIWETIVVPPGKRLRGHPNGSQLLMAFDGPAIEVKQPAIDNPVSGMHIGQCKPNVHYRDAVETIRKPMEGEGPEPEDLVPILQFFTYLHLPVHLQAVSKPFGDLAWRLAELLPNNEERSVALRKLLESKDAAVRARLAE